MPYSRDDALPDSSEPIYFELASNYKCRANRGLSENRRMIRELKEFMPLVERIPRGYYYGQFIGLYGRILESYPRRRRKVCYEYLYVWNGQLVMPHPMDYAPVYVFVDKFRNRKTVYYDRGHYGIGRAGLPKSCPVRFTINSWWHSFRLEENEQFGGEGPEIEGLVDDFIWHWWDFEDSRAKLTIEEELLDPYLLMESNSFSGDTSIIAEAINLVGLLFAGVVSYTDSVSEALRNLIGLAMPVIELTRKQGLLSRQLGTRLMIGGLILLASLHDYELVELGYVPSWKKKLPKLNVKNGRNNEKAIKFERIASEMAPQDLKEVVSTAQDTDLSRDYMSDLHRTLSDDSVLAELSDKLVADYSDRLRYDH